MLTLKAEYIAMLVFADICAFICTMCVLWLALRLSTILSLKTHLTAGDRGGAQPVRAGRNGRHSREQSWDEEQFGFSTEAEPGAGGPPRGAPTSSRRRAAVAVEEEERDDAGPPPEEREQDWFSADDVDVMLARAREDQKREDAVNFARNTRQQPGAGRPARAARGTGQ